MRVLVCGSRDFRRPLLLFTTLDTLHDLNSFDVVVHGDASGADRLAGRWALSRGIPVEKYPADWTRYGRAAGPIRNKQMLDEGKPDMVVAFPQIDIENSKGTKNMVEQARKAGISVAIY